MRPTQVFARLARAGIVLGVTLGMPRVGLGAPPAAAAQPDKRPHAAVATRAAPAQKAAGKTRSRAGKGTGHGKSTHAPARTGSGGPVEMASYREDVKLTPFPSQSAATARALAQNRRDELDDAERVARAPQQADRWQTVLFHLRNLDARSDPEGCFWRVVAYYRLGEVARARAVRQLCELPLKDQAAIEAEDAEASNAQPPSALAEIEPGRGGPPVANPAPYTGAAPTKIDR